MSSVFPDPWRELGEFIREQRSVARLSVRRLSDMAGISNPYLSQIERGLRRPSAEILQQIAKALQLSAETLYVRAGILDRRAFEADLTEAILADPHLNEEQKHTLLRIYTSFRRENGLDDDPSAPGTGADGSGGPRNEPSTGPAAGPATARSHAHGSGAHGSGAAGVPAGPGGSVVGAESTGTAPDPGAQDERA